MGALGVQDSIRTSSGFIRVWTLASAHALHLPTNSVRICQVESNFRFVIKSETSLCRGEHRRVMKLGVWPSELAFRFNSQDGKVRFLSIRDMQVDIQDDP